MRLGNEHLLTRNLCTSQTQSVPSIQYEGFLLDACVEGERGKGLGGVQRCAFGTKGFKILRHIGYSKHSYMSQRSQLRMRISDVWQNGIEHELFLPFNFEHLHLKS